MAGKFLRAIILHNLLPLAVASFPSIALGDGSPQGNETTLSPSPASSQEGRLEALKRDFGLFPYDQGIRINLIAAYVAAGKRQLQGLLYDEAAESFENARKLSPDNQDLGLLKGIAFYGGKHYDEAALALEEARRNGNDTVTILLYLGRVYYDSGELGKAIDAWNGALTLEPGNKPISAMVDKARKELTIESRMDKDYGSAFVISYDVGSGSDLADEVLDVLENAYNRVGYDLSLYPQLHIPVILYRGKDYRSVTAAPEWSGGMYDGKIRLPIGGAAEITPFMRGVLFHEYAHVVVGEITKGNCPVWLNEGLAEFEGRREFSPPLAELEKAVKTGGLIPFNDLKGTFSSLGTGKALLAYQQSYSLVDFMITSYGMHKVRDILLNLGKGMGSDQAIAAAFSDFRLDFATILQEWREYLARIYATD